jgi:CheY-like chemotaxis protein
LVLGKTEETKMNFRSITRIFSRTHSASLKYEECSNIGKKKILVVEDNSDLRKLLVLRIKESGYDTVEAATGLEALKQARATRPGLILMDLSLPVVHGDEAMVWLKADPLTRGIPVIVTTAFLFGTQVDRAIAAGAAEVLYKPFDLKSLHLVLQRHLSVNHQPPHRIPVTPAISSTFALSRAAAGEQKKL